MGLCWTNRCLISLSDFGLAKGGIIFFMWLRLKINSRLEVRFLQDEGSFMEPDERTKIYLRIVDSG